MANVIRYIFISVHHPTRRIKAQQGSTLRELVAFMCWRAPHEKGTSLQEPDDKGKRKVFSTEAYSDVLM